MNTNSRTQNSAINLVVNIVYQIFITLITFFSRRVFISTLGINYLGLSGLFDSIFSVLSLTELGISGAITYSMYKYIAEDNKRMLSALTAYYKKLYNRIAIIVGIIGIAILPFLKYLINLDENIDNIKVYYLLILANTVLSYLFVYKTTIVSADQRGYRLKIATSIIETMKLVTQILVLYLFKDYLIYQLVWITFTVGGNVLRSRLAQKWYPFIEDKVELEISEKKSIWYNIRSMFYYQIGGVIMNHTDNILISVLVNTTMVGLYSNYYMLFRKLDLTADLIFSSITASVGNLNVTATKEQKYFIFRVFMMVAFVFFALCSIELYFVAEDVIMTMVQKHSLLLPKEILIIGVTYFFVSGMCFPCGTFRTTTGLFRLAKYSMLTASILNIVLSIILGLKFGLFGIIFASLISRLATNIWYEPLLLYRKFFDEKVHKYYLTQIFRTILVIVMVIILAPVINLITIEHLYIRILVKAVIVFAFSGTVLFLLFFKTKEFKFLYDRFMHVFLKSLSKIFKKTDSDIAND